MSNESKTHDPRYWEKWRESGAVETIEDARLRAESSPIRNRAKPITAIGYDHERDISTLSIGEKVVASGEGWSTSQPECYCVVPGNNFKLGQMVQARYLPNGTQTVDQAYPSIRLLRSMKKINKLKTKKYGFNQVSKLGIGDEYSGSADFTILVWNDKQILPAEQYRKANFFGHVVDIAVCTDPNVQNKQLGDKSIIYHFASP